MKPYLLLAILPFALAACNSGGNGATTPETTPPATTASEPAQAPAEASPAATLDEGALGAYHWRLSEATNAQGQRIDALFVQEDKPVEVDFRDGRVSIANTCNRMGGAYTLVDGGKVQIGHVVSTMMACPDEKLAALDNEVGSRFEGELAIAQETGDPPALTLTTASGDVLKFSGVPTAETRYGGEGETVFLEIGPETKPCSHPLMPDAKCLQVREIKYDEAGLKVGEPGEWENFYQEIEGYTHEDGVRNVVRTKRYEVKNPPADAPNTAYVLDTVVETELTQPKK